MKNRETTEVYSDDESNDGDTCDDQQLQTLFNQKCKHVTSKLIVQEQGKKYILHLDATKETEPSIITATNTSVDILKLSQGQLAHQFSIPLETDTEIVDVKFAPGDNNTVYIACSKACIKAFDLRTPKQPVKEYTDSTVDDAGDVKTFASFDVAPDNRLLAAGTNLFDGDAFILFWDTRAGSLLGGYWESHTDDVTQVKFHPDDRNRLISGSTDGLINVYNLREESEDDALTECLNTEDSIEQLAWCGKDDIYCATHTHDVQMWRVQDATAYGNFKRELLSRTIMRRVDDLSYVAGCYADKGQATLLIGSNHKDGECLRGLGVSESKLRPLFDCKENAQRVRATCYLQVSHKETLLLTGGEKGILDVWRI